MDNLLKEIDELKKCFYGWAKTLSKESPLLVNAYNTYCDNERDGAGYIFDLDNKDDLSCLIKGGHTLKLLYESRQQGRYAICDRNIGLINVYDLRATALDTLCEYFGVVLLYSYKVKAYGDLLNAMFDEALVDENVIQHL